MPNRILRAGFLDSDRVEALGSPVTAESLYVRLMLVVDDFGRGDGRPGIVTVKTYPHRRGLRPEKVLALLTELQDEGLVTLYAANGKQYLEIRDFRQRTYSEKSAYPPPGVDVKSGEPPGTTVVSARSSEAQFGGEGEGEERESLSGLSPLRVVELWNEICNGHLPHVRMLTPGRRRHIAARLGGGLGRDEAWWRTLFGRVAASAFCCGDNPRTWRADLDFCVRSEDQVARILEGKYDGGGRAGSVRAAPLRRPDGIREIKT